MISLYSIIGYGVGCILGLMFFYVAVRLASLAFFKSLKETFNFEGEANGETEQQSQG